MKNVLSVITILSMLLPAGAYAATQVTRSCEDVTHREVGTDLIVELDLTRLGLTGSVAATLSTDISNAELRVEVEDGASGSQLAIVEAGVDPEVIHVQQATHSEGQLALFPVVEIFFHQGLAAIQLRDPLSETRDVIAAIAVGGGNYQIECQSLPYNSGDFAPTRKMNIGLESAIVGFTGYKRVELYEANLAIANLEIMAEDLTDELNDSLDREKDLRKDLDSLSAESLLRAEQCSAFQGDLLKKGKKARKALKSSGLDKSSKGHRSFRGLFRSIKRAILSE